MGIVTGGNSGNDISIVTTMYDETGKATKNIIKNIDEINNRTREITTTTSRLSKETGEWTKQVTKSTESGMQRFKFMGLNYLFFGMYLQRTFGGLQKSAISTFREIRESTEGATTALGTLSAASEYLQFTLGSTINTVLEPLLPLILDIVEGVADFIEQNPQLAIGLVAITTIGGVMAGYGAVKVFWENMGKGIATILPNLEKTRGGIMSIKDMIGAGIGLYFIYQGIKKITEDELLTGLSDALSGLAILGVSVGKLSSTKGTILIGISTALNVIDVLSNEGFSIENLRTTLKNAGLPILSYGIVSGNMTLIGIGAALIISDIFFDIGKKLVILPVLISFPDWLIYQQKMKL